MDGRGRWLDHVFVERLWRSLKYEEVHLKAYADGREARAGIGAWLAFYTERRPHQALAYRTPMAVWRTGLTAVDMALRLDDAGASPPCPQPQPQPKAACIDDRRRRGSTLARHHIGPRDGVHFRIPTGGVQGLMFDRYMGSEDQAAPRDRIRRKQEGRSASGSVEEKG
jgi:putative transposase